jgi:hypothetical protein
MRTRICCAISVVMMAAGDLWAEEPVAPPVPPPASATDGPSESKRCVDPVITPIEPTRGVFLEGPIPPPEDWLCHSNPDICGPICDFWFGAEYLAWRLPKGALPPLVTTGPQASGGILGEPGTRVLVGGERLAESDFPGGRFTAGMWLDYEQHFGLEGNYFFLPERSHEFTAESPGGELEDVIARPFFNVSTGLPDARPVPFSGFEDGTLRVWAGVSLQGGEVNFLCNWSCGGPCAWRIDWLAGIRYLQLTDELFIRESAVDPQDDTRFIVHDAFDSRTHFIGGQLGVRGECHRGRLFVRGHAKVALGLSHYDVDIFGTTVSVSADGLTTTTDLGGLLALSSNSFDHDEDEFAYVPELGLQIGFRVCEYCSFTVGYNFLYWSNVARVGDQIDTSINPSLVPVGLPPGIDPTQRPRFILRDTDFWAHGLSIGVQVQY